MQLNAQLLVIRIFLEIKETLGFLFVYFKPGSVFVDILIYVGLYARYPVVIT